MNEYFKFIKPSFSNKSEENLFSFDITRYLRESKETLRSPVIPLVFVGIRCGMNSLYVTDAMFRMITGTFLNGYVMHELESGVRLLEYNAMINLARRLNRFETMPLIKRLMIDDYELISRL